MTTKHVPQRARSPRLWADHGWPVFAGALLAVGVIGLLRADNPLAVVLVPTMIWGVSVPLLYGVLVDEKVGVRTVLRIATGTTAAVTTLVGLLALHPGWGSVALGLGAATSPPVLERLGRILRRGRRRPSPVQAARVGAGSRLDDAQVERLFAQLVEQLGDDNHQFPADS